MVPRRQESGLKRAVGARSGAVVNFRTAGNSGSGRRSSAVLPSVLTFLVIVASGGLLLMIEKGMLNSMETPPPRGSGRRLDLSGQAGRRSRGDRGDVDVESQVKQKTGSFRFLLNGWAFFFVILSLQSANMGIYLRRLVITQVPSASLTLERTRE